jgi:site-specific recombinase XerD
MNFVDPIRDVKKVEALKKYMLVSGNYRDYALVVLGLNSALRISDQLELRWEDAYDFDRKQFKQHIRLREQKTKKAKLVKLNNNLVSALKIYFQHLQPPPEPKQFIFPSRYGMNRPLSRQRAHQIISEAAQAVGIHGNIGCHSLRKTFGYQSWKRGVPLPLIMELFNHSNYSITKKYLGISQDDLDDVNAMVEL